MPFNMQSHRPISFSIDSLLNSSYLHEKVHQSSNSASETERPLNLELTSLCDVQSTADSRVSSAKPETDISGDLDTVSLTSSSSSDVSYGSLPAAENIRTQTQVQSGTDNTRRKKTRTAFTEFQLRRLHACYSCNRYLSTELRMELAEELGLTSLQVKNWFQNRRMKDKRQRLSSQKTTQHPVDGAQRKQLPVTGVPTPPVTQMPFWPAHFPPYVRNLPTISPFQMPIDICYANLARPFLYYL